MEAGCQRIECKGKEHSLGTFDILSSGFSLLLFNSWRITLVSGLTVAQGMSRVFTRQGPRGARAPRDSVSPVPAPLL